MAGTVEIKINEKLNMLQDALAILVKMDMHYQVFLDNAKQITTDEMSRAELRKLRNQINDALTKTASRSAVMEDMANIPDARCNKQLIVSAQLIDQLLMLLARTRPANQKSKDGSLICPIMKTHFKAMIRGRDVMALSDGYQYTKEGLKSQITTDGAFPRKLPDSPYELQACDIEAIKKELFVRPIDLKRATKRLIGLGFGCLGMVITVPSLVLLIYFGIVVGSTLIAALACASFLVPMLIGIAIGMIVAVSAHPYPRLEFAEALEMDVRSENKAAFGTKKVNEELRATSYPLELSDSSEEMVNMDEEGTPGEDPVSRMLSRSVVSPSPGFDRKASLPVFKEGDFEPRKIIF